MIDIPQFEREGFAMKPSLLTSAEVQELITHLEENARPQPGRGGVRDVMDAVPALREVASHSSVRAIVDTILGPEAFVVRSILFDKTEASNWKAPWHQDITIAVQERRDTEGYGPWSTKSSIIHVQPPTDVLTRMVTIRIHLDPCPATNGSLRVVPGTQQLGRLNKTTLTHTSMKLALSPVKRTQEMPSSCGLSCSMRPHHRPHQDIAAFSTSTLPLENFQTVWSGACAKHLEQ